jgi:hypothetical protein
MPAKALAAPGYRWRLGLIAVVCMLLALWFAKDGFYTYPQHNAYVQAFEDLKRDHPLDYAEKWWKPYEHEHDIKQTDFNNKKSQFDFISQYICLAIAAPIGLIFLIAWVRSNRWIASEATGLTTSWGEMVPFASMTRLNKERWRTKGIAVVAYRGADQIEHKLVLDDWKFQAPPTRTILMEVEAHLKDDQIVGGERERLPETGPAPENVGN